MTTIHHEPDVDPTVTIGAVAVPTDEDPDTPARESEAEASSNEADTARAGAGAGAIAIDGPTPDERDARLSQGADELVGAGGTILAHPRFLLVASATVMTIGLTAIILGWAGASRSTLSEEQMPYLISGGILGLALATIGGLMLLAHWLTVSVREAWLYEAARRTDHEALVDAIAEVTAVLTRQENANGRARGPADQRPLRAAPRRS